VVRVLEKRLGALPVVAEFGRRLRIAEIIDELCPVRPVAWISHGEVIEALVANRLTAPAPMVRVQEWAAAMAVEEAYGISPELLSDDRIARALDAIAPQLDAITGGAGAAAITEFGVDVGEDGGMDLAGPRKADPSVHLRRILVYSSANAAGQAGARALKLAKATGELSRLVRTAGTRFHPTPDAVAARITAIAAQRRVKAYLRTTITGSPAGKPVLSWHFDQAAIDAEAAADGWYALTASLEPGQASPAEVFRRYKGQHIVERRYGEFKGPLAVAPLFLKTNRRITALITVICLALLIFCLAGRQVRNALAPHGEMMTGLPGYGPAPARPTGRTIFQALADLRLIPAHDGNPATIPKPAGIQARLLDLLGIDISRPRWLTQ
jgi:Domain of unknown function (DUF4277)